MHYDQQQAMRSRHQKPERPPAPQVQPQEGILIDLSPDELRSMNISLKNQTKATKPATSILDEPIEVPTEGFELPQQNGYPLMPPRYSMPPQYLNVNSIQHDPFDTSHLTAIENSSFSSTVTNIPEPIYNNNPNRYTSSMSDPLNHMLNASLASLSLASGSQNDNVIDNIAKSNKVEKQMYPMLSEQLTTEAKDTAQQSFEQFANVPVTTTIRNYDPFSPIQTSQTFVNNNYPATYSNQNVNDIRSVRYESNIYNSVADSLYGENFYDAVPSHTPSVIYDSTASVYGGAMMQQQQKPIYDEVSNYDELLRQPTATALRQAPAPPTQSPLLSQQQIYRRLEKLNQHHSIVGELMNKHTADNITESEAKEALEANNWNQDLAARHFKIERLSK